MTEITIEVSAEDAKRIVDACKAGKLPGIKITVAVDVVPPKNEPQSSGIEYL